MAKYTRVLCVAALVLFGRCSASEMRGDYHLCEMLAVRELESELNTPPCLTNSGHDLDATPTSLDDELLWLAPVTLHGLYTEFSAGDPMDLPVTLPIQAQGETSIEELVWLESPTEIEGRFAMLGDTEQTPERCRDNLVGNVGAAPKKYKCRMCTNEYTSSSGVSTHIRRRHPEARKVYTKRFACNFCPKRFTHKPNLRTHIAMKHLGGECATMHEFETRSEVLLQTYVPHPNDDELYLGHEARATGCCCGICTQRCSTQLLSVRTSMDAHADSGASRKCIFCGVECTSSHDLFNHVRQQHSSVRTPRATPEGTHSPDFVLQEELDGQCAGRTTASTNNVAEGDTQPDAFE